MASPNLNEIVTTTLRNRSGQLADNVTNNNALLSRMKASPMRIEQLSPGTPAYGYLT